MGFRTPPRSATPDDPIYSTGPEIFSRPESNESKEDTGSKLNGITEALISVEWGSEIHSIKLTSRNWRRVKSGRQLKIRGKGYYYEGQFFWDYWYFAGGIYGSLLVTYGSDGGCGFEGLLRDATIKETCA